jgi:hypothetical protein
MIFYEVQENAQQNWRTVGYFLSRDKAKEYTKKFNTLVVVNGPLRIVEREFQDELED